MRTANDWADVYRYEWGINVVPSNGCQKYKGGEIPISNRPPPYRQYYDTPVPQEQHDKWKSERAFDQGIMKLTGPIWHREDKKDMLYCCIDCDNALAMQEIIMEDPMEMSKRHCIEMHLDDSTKCHWDFYVPKEAPLRGKASDHAKMAKELDSNTKPAFEIKAGNSVMFGCPSIHKNGSKYEYLGITIPQVMDGTKIQKLVDGVMKRYGLGTITSKEGIAGLVEPGSVIPEGHNRQLGILQFVDSLYRRTSDLPLANSFYEESAFWFAKNHTEEGYSDSVIQQKAKSSVEWVSDIIKKENNEKYVALSSGKLKDGVYEDTRWLIQYLIIHLKVPSKLDITSKILSWHNKVRQMATEQKDNPLYQDTIKTSDLKEIIKSVFNSNDIFEQLKNVAIQYGAMGVRCYFDADQHIELASYITERWHVKKLGLDGQLVHFDGRCYSRGTLEFIERQVQLLTTRIRSDTVRETTRYIESYAPVLEERIFEKHRHVIVLENGIYDIKSGTFSKEFSPKHFVMRQIPHRYDTTADPGESSKILKAIIGNSYDVFCDFMSICLYPDIGIYMMYVQLSQPGTGKKQVSHFIHELLGHENIEHFSIHDIAKDATNRIACARALLNIDEDMSDMDVGDVAYLLKWITMDTISSRSIYSRPVKFTPSSRLMANTNVLFDIAKESHMSAMNDRTHTAILQNRFRHTEHDVPDIIKNTVTQENYDHHITKILHNATRLYGVQRIRSRNSAAKENEIWNEFGNYIRKFCETWLEAKAGEKVQSVDLWLKWCDYSRDHGVLHGSQSSFYHSVEEVMTVKKTAIRVDGGAKQGFDGIRLRREDEVGLQTSID